ncbi:hypothetical protein CRYUN_Cryun29cG0073600 [Craigia yunnanensis]
MKKLFRTSYRILYPALKMHFENPEFPDILVPISHLHNSTKTLHPNSKLDVVFNELAWLQSSKPVSHGAQSPSGIEVPFHQERPTKRNESTIQISHPWQEWADLMEYLLKRGYFDGDGNPFENDFQFLQMQLLEFCKEYKMSGLQCKEKPPKRHLNPGEWECESRNMVCLKCDHKRPKAPNTSNRSTQFEYDNGYYINHDGSGFHNGGYEGSIDKPAGQDRKRCKGADMWRFVHEENEDEECLDSWTENSKFIDFPVTLSHNTEVKEKWKLEMS